MLVPRGLLPSLGWLGHSGDSASADVSVNASLTRRPKRFSALWTIADRCGSTLTPDVADSVADTDFVRRETIVLQAGQSYHTKARR